MPHSHQYRGSMRILCIHQNFPGQFRDIAYAMLKRGHDVKAICGHQKPIDGRIEALRYQLNQGECKGVHQLTKEVDEWIHRGELVATKAKSLKESGWAPDIIFAHPGWGETLMLKEVFPSSAQIIWPELWLSSEQMGQSNDQLNLQQAHYLRVKNYLIDLAMIDAKYAILPTRFQAKSFPGRYSKKIKVIHEGIDKTLFELPRLKELTINNEIRLSEGIPVVTFISRNLEPMRGFPEFMRSLPILLDKNKAVQVLIVGGNGVSYSCAASNGESWKSVMLKELDGKYDTKRVHFIPRLEYTDLLKVYRRSDLHVYLSNAFVLSWSLTEIMACGTPILASHNPMLEEIIKPGVNGALYSGTEVGLGHAIAHLLENGNNLKKWGNNGREIAKANLNLEDNLNRLENLIKPLSITY